MKTAGRRSFLRSLFIAAVPVFAALLLPAFAAAQESDRSDGKEDGFEEALAPVTGLWRKHYAAPSLGVVLYKVRVRQEDYENVTYNLSYDEREYFVPAMDVRIFRGLNITRRAGFFSGLEAGAAVFLPYEKSYPFDVTVTDTVGTYQGDYNNITDSGIDTFNVSFYGGTVFVMFKYGYRFELGLSKLGFSAGFQLGTGASLFSGGYDLYAGSRKNPIAKGGYGTHEFRLDIATDFSLEAAVRLGRNFRLFAAAGMLMTPLEIREETKAGIPGSEVLDDPAPTNEKYLKYALNHYEADVDGFGFSMRAGFSLNFN